MRMNMRIWILALVALLACNSAPPLAVDAGLPPPPTPPTETMFPPPLPTFTPTPMPSWLINPRPPLGNVRAVGTRPPIIPASWTVPAWFIDPANSSGNASDNNTCTTSGAPCLTYAEIAARWGTYSPRLRQVTTITYLSNQSGNTDPVYFNPYLENGASAIIAGTLTQVASVTLGTVTARNRATPQLLQADLGASGATNQLLINSTHPSHAWSYKVVAGTVFSISQPLQVYPAIPGGVPFPTNEVNTWANGDTVSLNTLTAVNIASIQPITTDTGSSAGVWLTNINVFDPGSGDPFFTSGNVNMVDVVTNRELATIGTAETGIVTSLLYNVDARGNFFKTSSGPTWGGLAGIFSGVSVAFNGFDVDCDTIINTNLAMSGNSNPATGITSLGTVYIETAKTLSIPFGRVQITGSVNCVTSTVLWGPGSFQVVAPGHAVVSSAGGATNTSVFTMTGGIKLGTNTTGCSHTGAAPDVINCGINLTGANLDAAAGVAGFGGNAFIPGGPSIGPLSL